MSDDYLWDKSGEPDNEIKRLEEILGVLRYQPRPFDLTANLITKRRTRFLPLVAIAATAVITLMAGGLWLVSRTHKASDNAAKVIVGSRPEPPSPLASVQSKPTPESGKRKQSGQQDLIAVHRKHINSVRTAEVARERREGLAAKAQLLLALRVASEKLNQAQKRAQSPTLTNPIRNQHKIG